MMLSPIFERKRNGPDVVFILLELVLLLTVLQARTVVKAFVPSTPAAWNLRSWTKQQHQSTHLWKPTSFMPTITKQFSSRNKDRFDRVAPTDVDFDVDVELSNSTDNIKNKNNKKCLVLHLFNQSYNLSPWAHRHPGGMALLYKHHNRNATQAFVDAGHSPHAYQLLQQFAVTNNSSTDFSESKMPYKSISKTSNGPKLPQLFQKIRQKLFTKEDKFGLHKYLGLYCLGHYIYRYYQMLLGDPSCGFGSCLGNGPTMVPMLLGMALPHALLSLSSLIFASVPRERIVGQPMIWQEFRLHNIVFGLRSVLTTVLSWFWIYCRHHFNQSPANPWIRQACVVGSCAISLRCLWLADRISNRYCPSPSESTTATMPYWENCSQATQRKFKTFYAFSQFQATATCLAVGNPAWTFSILLPIQGASFLMTLVRKGLLSAKGYHIGYSSMLALPYLVGLRSCFYMHYFHFPLFLGASAVLFQLRRHGFNKFWLWGGFAALRCLVGDAVLQYDSRIW